jgi:signal transduction histidine kinase
VALRLPALWRRRSLRAAAIPVLLVGAALAAVVALEPALGWVPASVHLVAALLANLLGGIAFVFWQGERAARRVRRALAVGISHDLRTPLAQIRMFTEMLLMGRERSEEERTRWLEAIEREAHHLGDVMENLLLFVHADEPDPFPVRQPTDLGNLIEDVAVGFAPRALQRRARIEVDPPAGVCALVDPGPVRQAVVNLLDNALRFGPAGQTVSVALSTAGGLARLTVTDQGPGIPVADRKRVWRPFVRLGSHAEADGGGGLGLAVVRRVAEAHGGRAWIEDAPGGGASVNLTLPLVTARRSDRAGSLNSPSPRSVQTFPSR